MTLSFKKHQNFLQTQSILGKNLSDFVAREETKKSEERKKLNKGLVYSWLLFLASIVLSYLCNLDDFTGNKF